MQIHICENNGFCMADCSLRATCKKQRINFLIHAVVIDYAEQRVYPDEYLNEIAILKQNLVDSERKKLREIATTLSHSLRLYNKNNLEIIEV